MEQLRCDSLTTMDGRCLKSQGSYRNPYQLGSAPKLELPGPGPFILQTWDSFIGS